MSDWKSVVEEFRQGAQIFPIGQIQRMASAIVVLRGALKAANDETEKLKLENVKFRLALSHIIKHTEYSDSVYNSIGLISPVKQIALNALDDTND